MAFNSRCSDAMLLPLKNSEIGEGSQAFFRPAGAQIPRKSEVSAIKDIIWEHRAYASLKYAFPQRCVEFFLTMGTLLLIIIIYGNMQTHAVCTINITEG